MDGTITISWQTIITVAAVISALALIVGYYNKAYKFVQQQSRQEEDIKAMKTEQTLLTYGVLACLKGLKERGCNGPVTEAINKIEKHLNQKAHE